MYQPKQYCVYLLILHPNLIMNYNCLLNTTIFILLGICNAIVTYSRCPFNSYTMAKRDLPDIYAQARGPQAQGHGIYIRQIQSGHGISNIYHSGMLT